MPALRRESGPVRRFFVQAGQVQGGHVTLTGPDAHHAAHVLRMTPGSAFCAVDEAGVEHLAEVVTVSSKEVVGQILSWAKPDREPRLRLGLLQALLKSERINLVLRQCTELGVAEFRLVQTRRVVARVPEERVQRRLGRWQEIVRSAAEQSGRTALPIIVPPTPWREAVSAASSDGPCIVLYEGDAPSLRSVLDDLGRPDRLWLGLGPEGGFEQSEIEDALATGAQIASIGPRTLRAETASVVGAAIAFYHTQDI